MASMVWCAGSSASGIMGISGPALNSEHGAANSLARSSVVGKSLLPQLRRSSAVSGGPKLSPPSLICVAVVWSSDVSRETQPDWKECQGLPRVPFVSLPKACSSKGVLHCTRGKYGAENPIRRRAFNKDDNQSDPFDSLAAQARELFADSAEVELNFFERLSLAWSILFPPVRRKSSSNADVAKQRLKMILISDRCSVNDEAKRRIVNNIVGALSDFVEIESEDKVQLTVSSDPSLGTVYSVTVPVRRVKPAYQEHSRELQNVALAEEFDDEFRTLDIKLEYPDAVDTPQA